MEKVIKLVEQLEKNIVENRWTATLDGEDIKVVTNESNTVVKDATDETFEKLPWLKNIPISHLPVDGSNGIYILDDIKKRIPSSTHKEYVTKNEVKRIETSTIIKLQFGLLSNEEMLRLSNVYGLTQGDNGGILHWQTYTTTRRIYVFFMGVDVEGSYLIGSCKNDMDQYLGEKAIVEYWELTGETGFIL